jgi:predicted amidohydrolase
MDRLGAGHGHPSRFRPETRDGECRAVLVLASALKFRPVPPSRLSSNWQGIDTALGNPASPAEPGATLGAAEFIQRTALESRARVVVFPEMVVSRWTEATEAFWDDSIHQLPSQGRTMLVGAGIPAGDGSDSYANAVIIKGSDEVPTVQQRVPVPFAMWKPWTSKNSVPLRPFGRRTIALAGERPALVICYEQLLPLSFVTAMLEGPTVLVGISNAFWTAGTVVPKVQRATMDSWGRLFSLPVVSATNI